MAPGVLKLPGPVWMLKLQFYCNFNLQGSINSITSGGVAQDVGLLEACTWFDGDWVDLVIYKITYSNNAFYVADNWLPNKLMRYSNWMI